MIRRSGKCSPEAAKQIPAATDRRLPRTQIGPYAYSILDPLSSILLITGVSPWLKQKDNFIGKIPCCSRTS
jgi:hypothetical protein